MNWDSICAELSALECDGSAAEVTGVAYDSRRVGRGDVFVAMRGEATDGNRFVDGALKQGAAAVVTDSREVYDSLRRENAAVGAALVEHGRRALAEVGAAVMGHPERRLALSAVTGTNGKTTTAFLLESMLRSVGRSCVLIGTIETHVGREVRESPHTTPEASDTLRIFADGVKAGATEAVMEMSSHALEQERVWGLPVDVAMFTNLTQDHLDFHGTMERYFAVKARLFEGVGAAPPRVAVINEDDGWGERLVRCSLQSEVMRYGMERGEYRGEDVVLRAGETRFLFKTPKGDVAIRSSLTGRVNVYNLLAASCAALARGLTLEQMAAGAASGVQVPGRFEVVPHSDAVGFTVVVDYAHTDDALRNLISLARELVKERGGRVITLFGCGGDRDKTKRPRMGRAAGEGSDLVVLTSDNPRGEEPMAIICEALAGVVETGTECIVREDRAEAIGDAIRAARVGDIVLIAGKGHEKVQIFKEETVPFDDVAVAAAVLKEIA
ncbi:MAG TPA: UDP-N-acetylmuramoyl-L-alanyl-D-glutamate--2,6-diaminopimelate ligase [Verrucomicrobiae bacterium]|nr:UDP-N-acetylmuramoyl-L-alanyl-D-glutamate--2,6-diaminopimelate ligase [Verrucomicrobiae bacterium]